MIVKYEVLILFSITIVLGKEIYKSVENRDVIEGVKVILTCGFNLRNIDQTFHISWKSPETSNITNYEIKYEKEFVLSFMEIGLIKKTSDEDYFYSCQLSNDTNILGEKIFLLKVRDKNDTNSGFQDNKNLMLHIVMILTSIMLLSTLTIILFRSKNTTKNTDRSYQPTNIEEQIMK
ncbi:uncharacterized protein LOC129612920 [Condylostylus longicornis]|uniref:uncharacterized protein LOC129612920 n=1 Tax=Condylostylus longicornis TaxID=2530218 RepID=UPI00244E4FE6|nr:uncharacterized protein LOC129612920 [Condylostylus longicornis]XP_055382734.1 uncharacterized protein LOC129612920 [Condylostylus longicornis]XP_055382735.1 uncharacterized protein LOC129612920 [Condylostylus longicornis]